MEVDLNNAYSMMFIKMITMQMMIMMMMKKIIALTQSIFRLGLPDFA